MGLTNINNNKTILITGKNGTGKSTLALEMMPNATIMFADSIPNNALSIPINNGIIIEDVHYNADKSAILNLIRRYRGDIVLTSINEKSVPKEIKNKCKIKRAGKTNYLRDSIQEIAPRSDEPFSYEMDMFSLCSIFLRETDRDKVKDMLLINEPSDIQILSWLVENVHPNTLSFIDGQVKRRWNKKYFYELLAYSSTGNNFGRVSFPKRGTYDKKRNLLKRIGIQNGDIRIFNQLKHDEEFISYVRKKLNNENCRLLGIKDIKKERKKKIKHKSLMDF